MKVKDIISKIEEVSPVYLAEDWDNPGLQIGDKNADAVCVYLTLDVNESAVCEAIAKGADMIVSHHPLYFHSVKCIDYATSCGRITRQLVENNITVYSAHTNFDKSHLNNELAKRLGVENLEVLSDKTGFGFIGDVKGTTLFQYASVISGALGSEVRVSGCDRAVSRVALCSGASADFIAEAAAKGADVMVTGDVKYHEALSAIDDGIAVIDAGHFGTEAFVTDIFDEIIAPLGVKTVKSSNKDCFLIVNNVNL